LYKSIEKQIKVFSWCELRCGFVIFLLQCWHI